MASLGLKNLGVPRTCVSGMFEMLAACGGAKDIRRFVEDKCKVFNIYKAKAKRKTALKAKMAMSVDTALTTTQETVTKDAFCDATKSEVANAAGVSASSIDANCSIAQSVSRRRLLSVMYELGATIYTTVDPEDENSEQASLPENLKLEPAKLQATFTAKATEKLEESGEAVTIKAEAPVMTEPTAEELTAEASAEEVRVESEASVAKQQDEEAVVQAEAAAYAPGNSSTAADDSGVEPTVTAPTTGIEEFSAAPPQHGAVAAVAVGLMSALFW